MTEFLPWEYFPSLKLDRLELLAVTIQGARNSVAPVHDAEAGDNNWSAQCRAYARQCHALRQLTSRANWLRVSSHEKEDLELSLLVESVPLKVYRGEADESPARHREFSRVEQMLMDRLLADMPSGPLRLVVTTENLRVSEITLVQFDDITPWRGFSIPIETDEDGFSAPQPDPTSPPPILPASDDRLKNSPPSWRAL